MEPAALTAGYAPPCRDRTAGPLFEPPGRFTPRQDNAITVNPVISQIIGTFPRRGAGPVRKDWVRWRQPLNCCLWRVQIAGVQSERATREKRRRHQAGSRTSLFLSLRPPEQPIPANAIHHNSFRYRRTRTYIRRLPTSRNTSPVSDKNHALHSTMVSRPQRIIPRPMRIPTTARKFQRIMTPYQLVFRKTFPPGNTPATSKSTEKALPAFPAHVFGDIAVSGNFRRTVALNAYHARSPKITTIRSRPERGAILRHESSSFKHPDDTCTRIPFSNANHQPFAAFPSSRTRTTRTET